MLQTFTLEQVPARAGADAVKHLALIGEHGDDDDVDVGVRARGLADQVNAVAIGQAKIAQQHIELARADHRPRSGRVARDPRDLDVGATVQRGLELRDDLGVILDDCGTDHAVMLPKPSANVFPEPSANSPQSREL